MPVRRLAAALLALILGVAPHAGAQQDGAPKGLEVVPSAALRSGFWGNFGLGVGSETYSSSLVTVDPGWLARPTLDLRAGGTPNAYLRLGGELVDWYNSEGSVSQTLGGLAAVVQVYPSPTLGFFLKGGGGYAWNWFGNDYYCYYCGGTIAYDAGWMWTAGGGWEIPVSRKMNIVPTVDYYGFSFGGRSTADYSEKLWNYSIAIQIH
jgi:hypothetical protein